MEKRLIDLACEFDTFLSDIAISNYYALIDLYGEDKVLKVLERMFKGEENEIPIDSLNEALEEEADIIEADIKSGNY